MKKILKSIFFPSLRLRLIAPMLVLVAGILFAMALVAVTLSTRDLERERHRRLWLISDTLTRGIRELMRDKEPNAIEPLLQALASHRKDVASVSLLRLDGTTSRSSHPGLRNKRLWPEERLRSAEALNRGFAIHDTASDDIVVRPIRARPSCGACHKPLRPVLGFIDIRLSHEGLQRTRRQLIARFAHAGLPAIALLSLACWWLISREAVGPIKRLVKAMRRAQAGDMESKADEGRPDEIGEAARGFDSTMEALYKSRAELEAHYQRGMERVERLATLGEVATGLAHEIKNPLAGLSAALDVLEDELDTDAVYGEAVHEMRHQVQRLTKTMTGLLNYARPPALDLRETDLNATLVNTLFLIHHQKLVRSAEQARIEVVEVLGAGLPLVWADAAQLEQVFLNLCLNALQAMEGQESGTLSIRSHCEGPELVVEISDTGKGIDPEVADQIFLPFYTTRVEGTGLGLATSTRIVQEHGGRIEWSTPPGGGTTFTVRLPRAPELEEATT